MAQTRKSQLQIEEINGFIENLHQNFSTFAADSKRNNLEQS